MGAQASSSRSAGMVQRARVALEGFFQLEAAGGILLIGAAALAMMLANSPWSSSYQSLLDLPFGVQAGDLHIHKPLLLWINDGLMAVFFLLVALEIKREALQGQLSSPSQIGLPVVAAIGGVAVPAAIYAAINWGDDAALQGWAIPSATDIAFALGILSLLGKRVPLSLKLLLSTVAVIDDLIAIVIIAVFYSADLSTLALGLAGLGVLVMALLNFFGVRRISAYLLVGAVVWVCVLKSGVHATLAGVVTGLFIPLRGKNDGESPLERLEHDLHPMVAYLILPLFAFANAGVALAGVGSDALSHPVTLGIALGLVVGKPLGVFGFIALAVGTGWLKRPAGASWVGLFGVALLCGIGFTMSLFIGSLAFEHGAAEYVRINRIGILAGSVVAAVAGLLWLKLRLPATVTD